MPPKFKIGDEAVIQIKGDEGDFYPGIIKAGVATEDAICIFTEENKRGFYEKYQNAVRAGDAAGIEELIQRGDMSRIPKGARVLILNVIPTNMGTHFNGMPPDPNGVYYVVRVLDGEQKGQSGRLRGVNLASAADAEPK